MADLPTLNKTVKEFRALIDGNFQRTQAQEEKRVKQQQLADDKLDADINKLTKQIEKEGEKASKASKSQLELLEQERQDRAMAKVRDQEIKVLAQKTLGINEDRLKEQKEASEVARGARQRLEDLRAQLQSQGVDIKANKNFQKLELEVQKKERAARLKAKPLASSILEQSKDAAKATGKQFAKYLGPNSFFGKTIGGFIGTLNSKLVSPFIGGIGAALKGGALILGLLALVEFLNSDLWVRLKDKIIPAIQTGLGKGLKALEEIFDDFFGVDGSFAKGFDTTLDKIFGDKGTIRNGVDLLISAGKTFAKGIGAAANILKLQGKDGEDLGVVDALKENIGDLLKALGLLAVALMPFKILRGVAQVGIQAVNWIVLPALRKSFVRLVAALTLLGQGADDIADETIKTKPSAKTTTRPSIRADVDPPLSPTRPGISRGASLNPFREFLSGRLPATSAFGAAARNIASNLKGKGLVSAIDDATTTTTTTTRLPGGGTTTTVQSPFAKILPAVNDNIPAGGTQVSGGYPAYKKSIGQRIRSLFGGKLGAAAVGGLTTLLSGIQAYLILTGDQPALGKVASLTGLLASLPASFLGFAAGAALGSPSFGGALLTGVGGAFIAADVASWATEYVTRSIFNLLGADLPIQKLPMSVKFLIDAYNTKEPASPEDFNVVRDPTIQKNFVESLANDFYGGKNPQELLRQNMMIQSGQAPKGVSLGPQTSLSNFGFTSGKATDAASFSPPPFVSSMIGGVNQVQVAPVSVETSSVSNVNNVIRQMGRGDIFTTNALQNLGAVAVG